MCYIQSHANLKVTMWIEFSDYPAFTESDKKTFSTNTEQKKKAENQKNVNNQKNGENAPAVPCSELRNEMKSSLKTIIVFLRVCCLNYLMF